ncbi:TVP38/TMEM64 family protein [Nitrosococcus watsonii]|uniref:TVP38/TMEM64 family membrane protein n=1 Tax=Nitrosococcus watsoni (strain C-113) TaxID=105559 RepID=D8K5M0_NITWC|nr:TVP38/TMEM64 family protein [Nitrosococcus watsonii]ADJ28197.1 SNARE associated Golgi protein-related protein [Nitrosococcus watsonii C-113]
MNSLFQKTSNISHKRPFITLSVGVIFILIGLYFFWPSFQDSINRAFTILFSGDREKLHNFVEQFGIWGPIVIILSMVAQMFLVVIPSVVLFVVSILAYGSFWGGVVALLAVLVASTVGYLVGRWLGPITVDKLIGLKTRHQIEEYVERYGFWTVIVIRFSPFLSNDAISFVGGLLRMNYWRFMAATFIGILPLIVLLAYLGETNERLRIGMFWISIISLIIFIAYILYDHRRRDDGSAQVK